MMYIIRIQALDRLAGEIRCKDRADIFRLIQLLFKGQKAKGLMSTFNRNGYIKYDGGNILLEIIKAKRG